MLFLNALLNSLSEVLKDNRVEKKYLVVPSMKAGYSLLEAVVKESSWFNVHVRTPIRLAEELTGLKAISDGRELFLLENVLFEMAADGELQYFKEIYDSGQLARVLHPAFKEIRLAGLLSGDLATGLFVSERKGLEIQSMVRRYESLLESQELLDEALIFRKAMDEDLDGLLLIPSELGWSLLEYEFLERVSRDKRNVLAAEPVYGIQKPEGIFFQGKTGEAVSAFSWLYKQEENTKDIELELFHSYGISNEVREVSRRIIQQDIPVDRVHLVYGSGERYIPYVYAEMLGLEIPCTFSSGIPLMYTNPAKLILQLLAWIEENYSASRLARILSDGLLFSVPRRVARVLRESNIGWGRDRYLRILDGQLLVLKREKRTEDTDKLEWQEKAVGESRELIQELFKYIPAEGKVSVLELSQGLLEILEIYGYVGNDFDGAAVAILRELLSEQIDIELSQKEAVKRIRAAIEDVKVGASGPKPGHLHVSGYTAGEWVVRPYTYVLGLDQGFPGSDLSDPVLLDVERDKLGLPLSSLRLQENTFSLTRFLASRRGHVTLGFSSFDVVEGRAASPAAIFLQAYRLLHGVKADYSELMEALGLPVSYLNAQAVTIGEWWLGLDQVELDLVMSCYSNLSQGIDAELLRMSSKATAYDGRVIDVEFDPRVSGKVLSATQLEYLASCPFAYFLRFILRVNPVEELVWDPSAWLNALQRGSFLHDLYAKYLKEAEPSRLMELADELLIDLKEVLPPPSERIYEREKEELKRGLEVFLRMQEELESEALFLEVPFGFGDEEVKEAGLGLADPVLISLEDGSKVAFRGKIDRLDKGLEGYFVWDFKTGSTYDYDDKSYYRQGTQLQHALYALVAEEILRQSGYDKASVTVAGYLFPTEKGEGQIIRRDRSGRECFTELLGVLFDTLAEGLFVANNSGKCPFCSYRIVCRSPLAVERLKEKQELSVWKELSRFE